MQKLLVVTSYPERGQIHSNKTVGVASYTKTLLEGVKKENPNYEIKVLAENIYKDKNYKEHGIEIQREWRRNDIKSLSNLFWKVLTSKEKDILVSFEIKLFGGFWTALLGISGLLFLKLVGKRTYILLHQVALDFDGLEGNSIKAGIMNFLSRIFYSLVKLSADKIFVFEEILKEKLGGENTFVLPHLILESEETNKNLARKKLGLEKNKKYGLYFGYIAPYKGVDWLAQNWPTDKSELIIAGGINPNYKNDSKMKKFVQKVESTGTEKNIKVTDFVKESAIKLYFSACDFVVLPYKMFFSSSGPLALAFAYKKPVLLSKTLKDYAKTEDFKKALKESGLRQKDIVFDFDQKSLEVSIKNVLSKRTKFEKFAKSMNRERNIKRISNLFFSMISNN